MNAGISKAPCCGNDIRCTPSIALRLGVLFAVVAKVALVAAMGAEIYKTVKKYTVSEVPGSDILRHFKNSVNLPRFPEI
jgi:hypothetical protein